ncbi:MAG: NTP transferase domain-containing protein [Phycisphaerae bacterium]|nr:NTP transferase domain-containing protein [Phycisphaerae bacterium]
MSEFVSPRPLAAAAAPAFRKVLNPDSLNGYGGIVKDTPVLVLLAAGAGTRFGLNPKCAQTIDGKALARHTIDAFRNFSPSPVICVVGYRWEEVSAALGPDNVYVRSDNPAGGTGFAAFEAFSVNALAQSNPLLIVAMGDRIVPASVFARLCRIHGGPQEADLTFLSAIYEPPKNRGKGRVLRDENRRVLRIVEERDITAQEAGGSRLALLDLTEGNCPLYAIRAQTLAKHLGAVTNANAQRQYYLTDIVASISSAGGVIRTVTTTAADPEYDVLCSDVTRPEDLAVLRGLLASAGGLPQGDAQSVDAAAKTIMLDRPPGQIASIARQLEELLEQIRSDTLQFTPDRPVAIGISGGRLRIAFMHPDMVRFFGPAWQMPIGAGDASGNEQIVMLAQSTDDRRIHLFPMNPEYRRTGNSICAENEVMYPGEDITDPHAYEQFGTAMSESLLGSLGYFSEDQLRQLRRDRHPLPPPARWISNNMRHPFALIGNAVASMRTLRGDLGERVRHRLGRDNFEGLSMVLTGDIPQGGFSSSSAVTVAGLNAMNALFKTEIPPDVLVELACQAEYGTGVRAGSLDQATEQKGKAEQGTLISSNPKDSYRILGTYRAPTDRFRIIFPYTVDRDREAWRWSWGAYAQDTADDGGLTTGETRKMTGKAAELAAVLTRLPLESDFFEHVQDDLVSDGLLSHESRVWICSVLRELPLLVRLEDLQAQVRAQRDWYVGQLCSTSDLDAAAASRKADTLIASLFKGWREPLLRRTVGGWVMTEQGVPMRAMVAYLFGEVAKNFYLIHHTDEWIEYVTRSQRGDRCVEIAAEVLPPREAMEGELEFERGLKGPELMDRWLDRYDAVPFDYNQGLDDASLSHESPPDVAALTGSNFFRGLALIDLAEAMLKRAFGADAVAVRINAAGQGDYWQVHVDTQKADPEDVKRFIRRAFYRRFGLSPNPDFVQLYSGGGAAGVRLNRFDLLPQLIQRLRM